MKKKVVSVLLTLALAATMLAGCGDKKTADSALEESESSPRSGEHCAAGRVPGGIVRCP